MRVHRLIQLNTLRRPAILVQWYQPNRAAIVVVGSIGTDNYDMKICRTQKQRRTGDRTLQATTPNNTIGLPQSRPL